MIFGLYKLGWLKQLKQWICLACCIGFLQDALARSVIKLVDSHWHEETLYVDVSTEIDFAPEILAALKSGLKLKMGYYFDLYDPRWYKVGAYISIKKQYTIQYDRLASRFLLADAVTLERYSFSLFSSLLAQLAQLRNLPLIDKSLIKEGSELRVSFRLDNDSVPLSLRGEVFFSDGWKLNAEPYRYVLPDALNQDVSH